MNGAKLANWIKFLSQFVVASRNAQTPATVRSQDHIINSLPAKKRLLFNLLVGTPMTSKELSDAMGYGSTSRTNTVLRQLRAAGLQLIVKRNGTIEYVDQTQASVALANTDTLWSGIDNKLRAYYARRASVLA